MNAASDTLVPTADVWPICDPYLYSPPACSTEGNAGLLADHDGGSDFLLPPPDPAQRLNIPVSPADQRRLDLHAALTVRGIAPRPGDQDAITAISSLGDAVTDSVLRWVTSS
ncbi:hypothetical protein ABZZ79_38560 [Streptomyces sp. NPDC006458]|uniref:hypothetical protein n=1 Tax=Streptomyces sp. NPDC006458 TaxID=3154302 RepID=UPI0033A73C23